MKKVLYFLAATLVAVAACNKPEVTPTPTPEPEPEPTPTVPDLTLSTPKIVDVEAESSIYTVKFDAGKDWTAVLSYPDGSNDGAVLENSSGKAAEAVELRVTFQGLDPEVQQGRLVSWISRPVRQPRVFSSSRGWFFWPTIRWTCLSSG